MAMAAPQHLRACLGAVLTPRPEGSPVTDTAAEARRQQWLLAQVFAAADAPPVVGEAAVPTPWLRGSPARQTRGLAAYRSNGLAAAERALAAAYPSVQQAVGPEALAQLARRLWRAQPPQAGDLALWGEGLPALITHEPALADWPWLPDLARLDWAVHRAASAADGLEAPDALRADLRGEPSATPAAHARPPLRLDALAAPDALQHRMQLHPALALVASPWPVATLWRAHQPLVEGSGPLMPEAAAALARPTAEHALVSRDGWRPQVQALAAPAAAFTQALLDGATLGEALSAAELAGTALPAFDFQDWLLRALRGGWILALLPPPPETSP